MEASWPPYQPRLLETEGGFDNDPHDNGNWTGGKVGVGKLVGTKYGIDAASHPGVDIANLTVEGAMEIYHREYCAPIRFGDLPAGIDVVTVDPAINNGVWRASGWLQAAVSAKVDHKVGDETVKAALASDARAVIKTISDARLGFDQGLGSLWARYGKGWTRRIAEMQAFALGLALAAAGRTPVEISATMTQEAHGAVVEAKENRNKATATAAGGAAGTATANQTIPDTSGLPPKWAATAVAIAAAIIVAYYLWHRHVARTRASAFAEAAKG